MTSTRLDDCRVIEIGGAPSGAYAGKLFAELGAEVVKIEPPQGDPLRRRESADGIENGALFAYLNTSKRSLVLDLDKRGRPPRARAVGGCGGRPDRERVAGSVRSDLFLDRGAASGASLDLAVRPLGSVSRLEVGAVHRRGARRPPVPERRSPARAAPAAGPPGLVPGRRAGVHRRGGGALRARAHRPRPDRRGHPPRRPRQPPPVHHHDVDARPLQARARRQPADRPLPPGRRLPLQGRLGMPGDADHRHAAAVPRGSGARLDRQRSSLRRRLRSRPEQGRLRRRDRCPGCRSTPSRKWWRSDCAPARRSARCCRRSICSTMRTSPLVDSCATCASAIACSATRAARS